jgi:transcriptional regulator with XRE-family HTH domain
MRAMSSDQDEPFTQTSKPVCEPARQVARSRSNHADEVVAANIRRLRLAAGVSLREIGEALGIALQSVRMFETGAHRVSASHLPVIARCLGVPIDALFTPASDLRAEAATRVLSLSRNFLAIDDTDLQAVVLALSGALAAAAQRRRDEAAVAAFGTVADEDGSG